jgi:hypothetical protein
MSVSHHAGAAVIVTGFVALDGKSNWLEGAMLCGVYLIATLAFFSRPDSMPPGFARRPVSRSASHLPAKLPAAARHRDNLSWALLPHSKTNNEPLRSKPDMLKYWLADCADP